ncbi:MAG: YfiR family protein [Ginsengibacter sp.]
MANRFLLFLCISALTGFHARGQGRIREANLKAAFIYNFIKYIDWDVDGNTDDFTIGIVGNSAVYNSLQEIANTRTAEGKKIVVSHFDSPGDITFCNILFIPANTSFSVASMLSRAGPGTLTIGEKDGLAQAGIAFNFIVLDDKLRFEANVKAILSAGLKASSQLLKLAKIVD